MAERTQPIHADKYWNDTGVQLVEGKRYRMSVVPEVGDALRDASFVARSIAGEDWKSLAHKSAELLHGKRIDDAKWFALIGTVNRQHPWVISDGGIVTAPATGTLVCFFNDVQLEIFYRNNRGWIILNVEPMA